MVNQHYQVLECLIDVNRCPHHCEMNRKNCTINIDPLRLIHISVKRKRRQKWSIGGRKAVNSSSKSSLFWIINFIDWHVEFFFRIGRGFPFEPKDFEDLAKEYGHSLRDGTHDLLELTNKTNVPVLVFSAGLGDSIMAVMRHEKVLYPNVKVVSNFLNYENGIVNGFTSEYPIIHTFNKNETVLQGTEYYQMVHNRKHVILMGYVLMTKLHFSFALCVNSIDSFFICFNLLHLQWFVGWCWYGRRCTKNIQRFKNWIFIRPCKLEIWVWKIFWIF